MSGIILEGADASGKSTLARKLAEKSKRNLFLAGGKPRDETHMWEMIRDQEAALRNGDVVDRVSSISQQVYREGLFFRTDLMSVVFDHVAMGNIIVYCRPPDHVLNDPKNHEWKPYDTEEWKANILSNQATFVARYDRLMSVIPCVIYDWTSEESTQLEDILCSLHEDGMDRAIDDLTRKPG